MSGPSAARQGSPESVSAVVVNYNSGAHLARCVESLCREGVDEVIVVDNASVDGSTDSLSGRQQVTLLRSDTNRGYGAGANRGVSASRHDIVLVCNPDLALGHGAVAAMSRALEGDARLAVVGPRIEEPGGALYPSARTFPSLVDAAGHAFLGWLAPQNRWSRRYKMLDWDHAGARRVDWVSGACLLVRRRAFSSLGGFDESYFMYMEDVDLCWRARRAGWDVGYEPAAVVSHVQGVSADLHPYRMILSHHRSLLRFANRSTEGPERALLPVVALGLGARVTMACARHRLETWTGARAATAAPGCRSSPPRHD